MKNKQATRQNPQKPSKKRPPKNPTDPNLLARDVIEAFLGEPLATKPKPKPKRKAPAKKK
jgi:hypothetical protein